MLAVDLRNLTKRFGPVTAVNDLTLQIEPGEIVVTGGVQALHVGQKVRLLGHAV